MDNIEKEKCYTKYFKEFDLVMVMEMMDESLVLLAHLLCLPLHFMVSLKKNARTEGKRVK